MFKMKELLPDISKVEAKLYYVALILFVLVIGIAAKYLPLA